MSFAATFRPAVSPRQRGMSLVEVAIGMVIIGILMSSALATYRMYQKTKAERVTAEHMALIEEAIGTFFSINGRYPIPQGFRIREGDVGYGREGTNFNSCAGEPTDNRVCRMPGSGGQVYIGNIPFQDLNMPMDLTLDGWGRRFTYAVSEPLTTGGATNTICVTMRTITAAGMFGNINCNTPDTFTPGNPVNQPEDIVIVSHGRDGYGAWTADGRPYLPCDTVLGTQRLNCDYNGTFLYTRAVELIKQDTDGDGIYDPGGVEVMRKARVERPGNNFFDDIVSVDMREDSNFWALVSDNIRNRDDLKVGIGLTNPSRPLEVDGSIKATAVQAAGLCADGGDDCMNPDAIAGNLSAMQCDQAGYMTGVANNNVYCEQMVPEFSCANDHVIVGVDADGRPICQNHANPSQCIVTVQRRNRACPTGQIGNIQEERQRSCPANTWSAWAVVANTCTPYVAPCATKPPQASYGVCTQKRDSSGALTDDWYCCKGTESCRTVNCAPGY